MCPFPMGKPVESYQGSKRRWEPYNTNARSAIPRIQEEIHQRFPHRNYVIPDVALELKPEFHPTRYHVQPNAIRMILPAKGILPIGSYIGSSGFGLIHPTTIGAAVLQNAGFIEEDQNPDNPMRFDAISLAPNFDFPTGRYRMNDIVNLITGWTLYEPDEEEELVCQTKQPRYHVQPNAIRMILPAKGILPIGSYIGSPGFGLIHPTTIGAAVLQNAGFIEEDQNPDNPMRFDAISLAPNFDFPTGRYRMNDIVNLITGWTLYEPDEEEELVCQTKQHTPRRSES